ncbi:protein of unknown function [Methylocaldum szegediense]|uniref:Uncharacterized protein n=1 Tax=Methylocaldum szegediense TaxID=73780 RepID=A0ABM9HWQ7_9GAMM|nr:protein of unknown function [Methylocaldum szegediense]
MPVPLCWVATVPGTTSTNSPTRDNGRYLNSGCPTTPCDAESTTPRRSVARPCTSTASRTRAEDGLSSSGKGCADTPSERVHSAMLRPRPNKKRTNVRNWFFMEAEQCLVSKGNCHAERLRIGAEQDITSANNSPKGRGRAEKTPSCLYGTGMPVGSSRLSGREHKSSPACVWVFEIPFGCLEPTVERQSFGSVASGSILDSNGRLRAFRKVPQHANRWRDIPPTKLVCRDFANYGCDLSIRTLLFLHPVQNACAAGGVDVRVALYFTEG